MGIVYWCCCWCSEGLVIFGLIGVMMVFLCDVVYCVMVVSGYVFVMCE